MQLASARNPHSHPQWQKYTTPVQVSLLNPYLRAHPDATYAAYIADGLRNGFRIGYDYTHHRLKAHRRNHPSCQDKPSVVTERIVTELHEGRLLGPLSSDALHHVHVSPLGLVPKPHQPNKYRLIVDLSCPDGRSVNDGISSETCSLQYASLDDAVAMIRLMGRGTKLVKVDLKDAYRIIPVHPSDYSVLGIAWKGKTYIDRALPFGLRSAPKIFSAVADFIAWALYQQGVAHQLHYLDDFLFLGAPNTEEASRVLETVTKVLHMLGIPIAVHKTEGPDTILVFLGILIDTLKFELRLPTDKLTRLQQQLDAWSTKTSCRKRELESLLGHLSHAATVMRYGRTFLRHLFSLLPRARANHHYIHLTSGARADLLWWKIFLHSWNGRSFFPHSSPSPPTIVTSDASGSFGCGAFCVNQWWFQLEWPSSWKSTHIAAKELVPVVIAAAIWGSKWYHKHIIFQSDNMAVVEVLRTCTSRDPILMHLLRCFAFFAAVHNFSYEAQHVPGTHNVAADAISRNNLVLFASLVPQVLQVPIPQPVRDLLVDVRPDWGSHTWTILFNSSWTRASQAQPEPLTSQAGANTISSVTPMATTHSPSPNQPFANLQQ